MGFSLHPNLLLKHFLLDLPLCRVLLEDERNYPWIILVPRRSNISRMCELSKDDQYQLIQELDLAQKNLWEEFQPTQLNVAALGNKTPQLHIHVIARFTDDPAWPHTVWDHPTKNRYSQEELQQMTTKLKNSFNNSDNLLKQP